MTIICNRPDQGPPTDYFSSRLGRIAHYVITITRAYDVARRGIRVDNKFNAAARTTDSVYLREDFFSFHQDTLL